MFFFFVVVEKIKKKVYFLYSRVKSVFYINIWKLIFKLDNSNLCKYYPCPYDDNYNFQKKKIQIKLFKWIFNENKNECMLELILIAVQKIHY